MSSGVPRGGGKNTRQDNVNMASSDGSMQNFPRMGGKAQPNEHMNMTNEQQQQQTMTNGPRGPKNYYPNEYSSEGMMQNFNRGGVKGQFPDHSTMPPNERVMHPGGTHSMQQPQFTAQANVPPMPLNNPSLFLQSGSIKTEAPGYYTMQMGNPNMPPTQPPFAYAPIQQYQQPNYPPGPYYPQSQGYAQQYQPHQPYMNPNQMPPQQPEMSAMTQGTQQAPPQKRERKPLLILDPESKKEVELVPTTKPPSNNPTPNTTVDNAPVTSNHKAPPSSEAVEERKNTFLKDFARQVGETIPTEKTTETVAPVAQSEPKAPKEQKEESTPEAHTEQPESIPTEQPEAVPEPVVSVPEEPKKQASEEPAVPAVALESVAEVTSKLENVKIEEPEEVGSTEHPADPTQREDEDQESLLGAPDGFGAASSNYVEDVPEGDEDEEDVVSPEPNLEEEQRIREEEEAERLRQREIELDALQAELQLNKEECDEDIGYYGRSFMYCIRDIEKEFKRTEPPVPLDVLKNNHGIDIHSMPKNADNKKRTDFNPPWHNKGGSMQGNRQKPYAGGRHSQDHRSGGRGGGKQPYKSRNSIDRAPRAQLQHRADNAWKAEKIVDLDKEEAKIKKLLKDVRSLLNKITPTTKEDLIREFLTLQVAGPPPNFAAPEGQLTQVINIIFDKAVEEPRFCAIYSEICKRQVESELKVNNKQSPFRNAILSRSQDTFVSKTMDADKEAIDQEIDEDKKKEMLARWEEDYNKFRRRKFGNINFIGQLYEQQLMSTKIIQWCLYDLLRHSHPDANNKLPEPPYDEESIQCATQLMEAVGRSLENCRDFNGVGQYIEQIFSHFMSIAPNCSPKIKFKIYGVKELRDNQWRPRKVADQGPKKITEIHQDIQQEQQQQQQERDAYERRQGGGGVRQQSNSLRRPPPSRNSLDSRFSNPQNKRAAAGTASKLAPTNAAPRQMSMSITGGAGTQKKSWKTGAAGGGTSNSNIEAPGSRTIIQRQSGSREGSESRKSSQLGDRDAALAAARDIGGSKLNNKNSSSQLSVVSQEDQERIEAEKAEREEKQKKIANSIRSNLEELQAGDATEKEVVEDLFGYVDNTKYGSPDLPDVFQRFTESYVQKMSPQLRPIATKIIYNCLAQPEKKSDIIKGIENYCQWAINTEVYEDCPKLWDQLAELIVNLLLTTPETNPDEDIPKTEAKGASLNDFSPVFLAASEDDRPNKIYSLLIQTLRIMAEQLAKKGSENLMGLTMDFDDLSCRKELKEDKLTAALRSCNVDCVDFKNLYDVLNH